MYRGLDAATAKPPADLMRVVPHHLVGHVDPRETYTVARYVDEADAAVAAIVGRGRVPVVAGGSGMYVWGLLYGLAAADPRDERLAARLRALVARHGPQALHRRLVGLDPASAARIAPRDRQRVVRAVELALAGGPTWSERLASHGTWARREPRYEAIVAVLDLGRDELSRRLDRRLDGFFARGLVEEVRGLLLAGVPADGNALKAIGYREVADALGRGDDPASPGVRDAVRRATRRYAKRQRTWYRRQRDALRLDASRPLGELVEAVARAWNAAG